MKALRPVLAFALAAGAATASAQISTPPQVTLTPNGRIDLVVNTFKGDHTLPAEAGVMVLVRDHGHVYFRTYGYANRATQAPLTWTTLVPIASITKTFTSAMLAAEQWAGVMTGNEKIGPYIGVNLPNPQDDITLQELADYRAGLPRSKPSGVNTKQQLYQSLANCTMGPGDDECRVPGTEQRYSNYGYSVLGNLLADYQNRTWADMTEYYFTQPMALTDTRVSGDFTTADFSARSARGYDVSGAAVSKPTSGNANADNPAGGLWSTATDMNKWLAAFMQQNPQAPWYLSGQVPDIRTPETFDPSVKLGWRFKKSVTFTDGTKPRLMYKPGTYLGYHSYMGLPVDAGRDSGVFVILLAETDGDLEVSNADMNALGEGLIAQFP